MAAKICTACGYEGAAIKRPSDAMGERDNETQKAFDKVANVFTVLTFIPVKPLALLLAAPMYIVLWPIKRLIRGDGKVWCPNCGLPTMVKLSSDAGWLAKRKQELKAGANFVREENEPLVFGREIKLPGEGGKKAAAAPTPRPEKLPSLEVLLVAPEKDSVSTANEAEKPTETKPKKPVNPDEW